MKSNKTKRGVGRPESKVVWPNGRFTREQAFQLNGCYANPARVCKLTVINHLNAALEGKDSVLVKMDELGKTKSESGLGRKPFIYLRRSQRDAGRKSAANLRKAKANVSVPVVDAAPAPAVETPAIGELINS
jgi:hypothetical protein